MLLRIQNLILIVLFVSVVLLPNGVDAQCAMCKAASESNLKAGGGDPAGLNNGILYMLALPYLIVGGIAWWWYKNQRRDGDGTPEWADGKTD